MKAGSVRMSADGKAVLRLVWLGVTLATAAALVASFVLPQSVIASAIPECDSKRRYGRECVLCGTTTGFFAVAHGDFASAAAANPLAIPLFTAFSLNAVVAAAYVINRGRKRFAGVSEN
jgi:hypothetical protein